MTPLFRPAPSAAEGAAIRPRLGFLGVGRIGRQRMEALVQADAADVLAIADTSPEAGQAAQRAAPLAHLVRNIDELCAIGLDGIVIATPSGLHAAQATQALRKGVSVFCQKPLARTAAETRMVIDAARAADRLLAVDMSYRFTAAVQAVQTVIAEGHLGEVYAADLVFHNAYGPDKPWSRDPSLSGGGCLIDLGVHLVDLVRQFLPGAVTAVTSRLFSGGKRLARLDGQVEDYATLRLDVSSGATAFIACSWNVHAGCDAVIEARLYGTRGGASVRNVNGSFLDFVAERGGSSRLALRCTTAPARAGSARRRTPGAAGRSWTGPPALDAATTDTTRPSSRSWTLPRSSTVRTAGRGWWRRVPARNGSCRAGRHDCHSAGARVSLFDTPGRAQLDRHARSHTISRH